MPTSFCNRFLAFMTFSGLPVIEKVTTSETFILVTTIFSTFVDLVILSHTATKSFALGFCN